MFRFGPRSTFFRRIFVSKEQCTRFIVIRLVANLFGMFCNLHCSFWGSSFVPNLHDWGSPNTKGIFVPNYTLFHRFWTKWKLSMISFVDANSGSAHIQYFQEHRFILLLEDISNLEYNNWIAWNHAYLCNCMYFG